MPDLALACSSLPASPSMLSQPCLLDQAPSLPPLLFSFIMVWLAQWFAIKLIIAIKLMSMLWGFEPYMSFFFLFVAQISPNAPKFLINPITPP